MLLSDALFCPGNQASSSEPPTETLRQTVIQAITKISAMSQVIYVPGELKRMLRIQGRSH